MAGGHHDQQRRVTQGRPATPWHHAPQKRALGNRIMRNTLNLLVATTALCALSQMAMAQNFINIDQAGGSTGATGSLAITQDSVNNSNNVSGATAGASAFNVRGKWSAVSINQTGKNNSL